MSNAIVEQLKAQLAKLAQDRKENERAVAQIKAMEAKTRNALASGAVKLEIHIGIGANARTHVWEIKPFTLIGTATRKSDCTPELLSCFSLVLELRPYSNATLAQIAEEIAAKRSLELDSESARLIAINPEGRPHQIESA